MTGKDLIEQIRRSIAEMGKSPPTNRAAPFPTIF